MQGRRLLRPATAAVILSVVGGCVGKTPPTRNASLVSSAHPYEPGIPLPAGFRLADQGSEDWSSGPVRYVRHRYIGRADKYAVRKFYREQMPLVRWTATSDNNVNGRIMMRFRRQNESCTVTIEDDTSGFARRVAVQVMIAPSAP